MDNKHSQLTKYWQDHFEQNADKYLNDHAMILDYGNNKIMEQIHASILEAASPKPNAKILDAGCGTGDLTIEMYSQIGNKRMEVFHIDLSEKILQKARGYLSDGIGRSIDTCIFAQMDLMHLGYKDNYFDIAISAESLQHTDILRGISELIRVTKKCGKIVISIPNKRDPVIKRAEIRNRGRFQGIDIANLLDFLQKESKVRSISTKPLIFAEDQRELPYCAVAFKSLLSPKEANRANRFVISISV